MDIFVEMLINRLQQETPDTHLRRIVVEKLKELSAIGDGDPESIWEYFLYLEMHDEELSPEQVKQLNQMRTIVQEVIA